MTELQELQEKLSYRFRDLTLLRTALTHSSYANEGHGEGQKTKNREEHNERLEFLGDSVLSMVTTDYLYRQLNLPEGELTKVRASVVCESALHSIALSLDLGRYIRLGKGEEMSGGRTRVSILADATEALLAALYLDGGVEAAKALLMRYLPPLIETALRGRFNKDYKTVLQEIVQKSKEETISYVLDGQDGPDHDKRFRVTLYINSNAFAKGEGKSKKEAEQHAAREALALMGEE